MSTVYGNGIRQQNIPLCVLALVISFPAFAQSSIPAVDRNSQRLLLVSIPDRKLVVIEHENAVATFDIAVGAAESPSPTGEFQIVNRVVNPTYYHPGTVIPSGKNNPSARDGLDSARRGMAFTARILRGRWARPLRMAAFDCATAISSASSPWFA